MSAATWTRVTRRISAARPLGIVLGLAAVFSGCTVQDIARRGDSTAAAGLGVGTGQSLLADWHPPSFDSLGKDPASVSIRRGAALVWHTRDSLPRNDPSTLNCTSCHLDGGRRETAIPLFGVQGIYPEYNARADAVIPIEERVDYCFTRSLAGVKLAADSRAMRDIVSYLAFLSRGVPGGTQPFVGKLPDMPKLVGDPKRGSAVFSRECVRCHGADGGGTVLAPALWGRRSFSIAATLSRAERAASFIRYNMPYDKPGTLSDADAFDVAAFVTSHARPDMPGKERDWPRGDAPADVPYTTANHYVAHPVPVIRPNP